MCLAVDADKHLIKMPAPVGPVTPNYPPFPDLGGKQRAKAVAVTPNDHPKGIVRLTGPEQKKPKYRIFRQQVAATRPGQRLELV